MLAEADPLWFVSSYLPAVYQGELVTNTICCGVSERPFGAHVSAKTFRRSQACLGAASKGASLMGLAGSVPFVARKCLCNAETALRLRHGVVQPTITADFEAMLMASRVLGIFARAEFDLHPRISFDTWLAKWPIRKQQDILSSMLSDDIAFSRVKAMIKREALTNVPSRARLIQMYVNLKTQGWLGPMVSAAQDAVLHAMSNYEVYPGVRITAACGMNSKAIADWMTDCLDNGYFMFWESDGKNWDGTMQRKHLDLRLAVYRELDSMLATMIARCWSVRGTANFAEGGISYRVEGTVKSGHNDTTLGNTIVRALISADVCRRLGLVAQIIAAGDDVLVACRSDFDDGLMLATECEYGIVPEARKLASPFDCSFISGIWVSDGTTMGFVPKPGRLLAKLWWTVNPPPVRKRCAYQRGVARGLAPMCGDLPVIGSFLRVHDTAGEAISSNKYSAFRGASLDFGPGIYSHFAARYALSVDDLMACDVWLASLTNEPALVQHHVIQRMIEYDLADLAVRPVLAPVHRDL